MHRTRNDLSLRTRTTMVALLNARLADAGGEGTADLFTGISRDTDKYLWMLEAHL